MKSEGIACVACRSPQEALAAARRGGFELALVDLNYVEDTTSGKEGLALITALRDVDAMDTCIAKRCFAEIRAPQNSPFQVGPVEIRSAQRFAPWTVKNGEAPHKG